MPILEMESVTVLSPEEGVVNYRVEGSIREQVSGREAIRWYQDSDISKFMRIRIVACFSSDSSPTMDYLKQRFNQYMDLSEAGIQEMTPEIFGKLQFVNLKFQGSVTGIDNEGETFRVGFIPEIIREFATTRFRNGEEVQAYSLEQDNELRPFYIQGSRERFQNNPARLLDIRGPNDFSDLNLNDFVVYDRALNEVMQRNENGDIINRDVQEIRPNIVNETETFVFDSVPMTPVTIGTGEGQVRPITEADQLSFYGFTYLDYGYFVDEIGVTPEEQADSSYILNSLNTGMSKIECITLRGDYYEFDPIEIRTTENDAGVIGYASTNQTQGPKTQDQLTIVQKNNLNFYYQAFDINGEQNGNN